MLTFPVGLMNQSSQSDPYLANVVLHLKGDGANNSTNIVDSSPNPKTVNRFGNTKIDTTQSKYGGSSIYFDGNGDYITLLSNSDFAFSGDFTIEGWFYFERNNIGYQPIINSYISGDQTGWILILETNNTLHFYGSTSSGWNTVLSSNYVPPLNTWVHIAVSRSASSLRLFVNGNIVNTSTSGNSIQSGNTLAVSYYPFFPGGARVRQGYVDSLRITKGVARYTANFNPETDTYLAY